MSERIRSKELIVFIAGLGLLSQAFFYAFSKEQRREWFNKEFQGKCEDCGRKWSDGWMLEYDHTVPVSKGGPDTLDNASLKCQFCHRDKHKRDKEWKAVRMINARIRKTGGRNIHHKK